MMKNFTPVEVVPCNSKSGVLLPAMITIYLWKGHAYLEIFIPH